MAMTTDDTEQPPGPTKQDARTPISAIWDSLFRLPPPLKRIFDQTPLVTYPENTAPLRSGKIERRRNVLYIFTTDEAARKGRPSFNPSCLKWQVHLKFEGVEFVNVSSSNHASPSGSLPFLLPSTDGRKGRGSPVVGGKLKRWVATQQKEKDRSKVPDDVRYEPYASVVDHGIRRAWLYQLYLDPANYPLLHRLYIAPCSSNPLVQLAIAHQLRSSASAEIIKSNTASSPSNTIDEDEIFRGAEEAFAALAELLGEEQWFFGQEKPGLFDASLFAYTELLLDDELGWAENRLGVMLRSHAGMVKHRERIRGMYF
ncbi:phosphatidylserine decarboxylase [Recurvomyces mirabilis]|nr:phosphatidylserine decarboxylase [Recurvomyces mirabilis]